MNFRILISSFLFSIVVLFLACEGVLSPKYYTHYIAYADGSQSRLFLFDDQGSNNKAITDIGIFSISALTWFPHSKKLVYACAFEIYSKLEVFDLVSVRTNTLIEYEYSHIQSISVSPAGNQIVYQIQDVGVIDPKIAVINSDGTNAKIIADLENDCVQPQFCSLDNTILFNSNRSLFKVDMDGSNLNQITSGIDIWTEFSISPDGSQVAVSVALTELCILDLGNFKLDTIYSVVAGENYILQPTWSPDGGAISFLSKTPDSVSEIYIYDFNSGQVKQVTFEGPGRKPQHFWLNSQEIVYSCEISGDGYSLVKTNLNDLKRNILLYRPEGHGIIFSVSSLFAEYF